MKRTRTGLPHLCWAGVLTAITLTLSVATLANEPTAQSGAPEAVSTSKVLPADPQIANAERNEPELENPGELFGGRSRTGPVTATGMGFVLALGGLWEHENDDDDEGDDDGDDDDDRNRRSKPPGAPVPEPSTWMGLGSLLAICLFAAFLRKRK